MCSLSVRACVRREYMRISACVHAFIRECLPSNRVHCVHDSSQQQARPLSRNENKPATFTPSQQLLPTLYPLTTWSIAAILARWRLTITLDHIRFRFDGFPINQLSGSRAFCSLSIIYRSHRSVTLDPYYTSRAGMPLGASRFSGICLMSTEK